MKLIQELTAINEGKDSNDFQIKMPNGHWEDLPFDKSFSLEGLVKDIQMDPSASEANDHHFKCISDLHSLLTDYYIGGAPHHSPNKADIEEEDYEVVSFQHDTLRVRFKFHIVMRNQVKDGMVNSHDVEGEVTLMPAV